MFGLRGVQRRAGDDDRALEQQCATLAVGRHLLVVILKCERTDIEHKPSAKPIVPCYALLEHVTLRPDLLHAAGQAGYSSVMWTAPITDTSTTTVAAL